MTRAVLVRETKDTRSAMDLDFPDDLASQTSGSEISEFDNSTDDNEEAGSSNSTPPAAATVRTSTPVSSSSTVGSNRSRFGLSGNRLQIGRVLQETAGRSTGTPRRVLAHSSDVSQQSGAILEELKKVSSRLESFSERLDSLDGRLKSMENMQVNMSTSMSSTDEAVSKTKRKVPSRVSVSFFLSDVVTALVPRCY